MSAESAAPRHFNAKSAILLLLSGVAVAVVVSVWPKPSANAANAPTSQPAALLAVATAQPTMQPTIPPLPTIDQSVPMTKIAIDRANAENANMVADAAQKALNITATSQALAIIAGNATQTQVVINATGTPEAAKAQAFVLASQQDVKAQKERSDNETKRLADEANRQSISGWMLTIGVAVIILGVIVIIVIGVVKISRTPAETPITPNQAEEETPNIFTPVQTSGGTNQGFIRELEITPSELLTLRRAFQDLKGHLTIREVVAGEYFSDPRWREIYHALLEPGLDGVRLAVESKNGRLVFTQAGYHLLGLSAPTPLAEKISPITQENPGVTQHNTTQKAGEVVGGGAEVGPTYSQNTDFTIRQHAPTFKAKKK